MEIRGKIVRKFDIQSGVSKSGTEWVKQEYVLETNEQYPKSIFFDFFGEKAKQYQYNIGDDIVLSFDIDSREYNGRWYTGVHGWRAEKVGEVNNSNSVGSDYGDYKVDVKAEDDMPF